MIDILHITLLLTTIIFFILFVYVMKKWNDALEGWQRTVNEWKETINEWKKTVDKWEKSIIKRSY